MDGNGRWAQRRGLPRAAGHREGIEAVRRVIEAASDLGVATLTLYAFSADNWKRPPLEVELLMLLLRQYLRRDLQRLLDAGVRLQVIGRRDRLPEGLAQQIATAEAASAPGARLALNVAIDYGARRDRQCGDLLARRRLRLARGVRPPARVAGARHRPRRRPVDPHRRREAALGFPALGERLRGALLRRHLLARFRRRTPARRDPRLPTP